MDHSRPRSYRAIENGQIPDLIPDTTKRPEISCDENSQEIGPQQIRKRSKLSRKMFRKDKSDRKRQEYREDRPLLKRLEPSIRLLQFFGYYRLSLPNTNANLYNVNNKIAKLITSVLLTGYCISLFAVNASLFTYNCIGMHSYRSAYGILHALTVSWIITGLKPCVNFVQIALFFFAAKNHERLLFRLQQIDEAFYELTGKRKNVTKINKISIGLTVVSLLIPFTLRVADILYKGANLFSHWLNTVSPILVPLLTAWGVVPLIHFAALNCLMRYWFKALCKEIRNDSRLTKRSLEEYFTQYKLLTSTLYDFGIFNVFIGFSLAWSVLSVCLAVYFVTQARELVVVPEYAYDNPDIVEKIKISIYCNLGWSLVQILVALLFIFAVTVSGYRTNEELNCFAHSLNSIRIWGISLFRAFPIQRSTLLTMTSLMFTYAILLMRLSPHTGNGKTQNSVEISNETMPDFMGIFSTTPSTTNVTVQLL